MTFDTRCGLTVYRRLPGARMPDPAAYPNVATCDEWLAARKTLLGREREVTHLRDAVSAERKRLPMVRVDKDLCLRGTDGELRLIDMFDGRGQLYIRLHPRLPRHARPGASTDRVQLLLARAAARGRLHDQDLRGDMPGDSTTPRSDIRSSTSRPTAARKRGPTCRPAGRRTGWPGELRAK